MLEDNSSANIRQYEFSQKGREKALADAQKAKDAAQRSRTEHTRLKHLKREKTALAEAHKIEQFLKRRRLMPATEQERQWFELERILDFPLWGQAVLHEGKWLARVRVPIVRDPEDGSVLFWARHWVQIDAPNS